MVDSKENDKFELGVKGLNQTNPKTSLMTLALQNIKLLLPYPGESIYMDNFTRIQ